MGTSIKPVLLILPTSEKILVPLLPSLPILVYQSAPFLIMSGTLAQVSTLLRLVGCSQRPFSTVCTYFALGSPTLPSSDAINAVDSPQTKAPPPRLILTLKSKPEPSMFFPSSPSFSACSMAIWAFFTASGYSLRM
ncbi:hypothetical protein ES703_77638 [subsurface metagenome]